MRLTERDITGLALLFFAACSVEREAPGAGATTAAPWRAPAASHGAACADCHPDLVEAWNRTGMASALGPVDPGEFTGLARVGEDASGYRYALERTDSGAAIVETRADSDHRIEAELAFAIGAGVLDRSYAAVHGELLWFAPLEVVATESGRHAALAPGHMIAPGARLTIEITPECLGCHTDALPPRSAPHNQRPAPERWTPRGISCAACHGAVDEHVAWREADLMGEDPAGADPILRPSALSRVQRLSICASCHLQGDARIVLEKGALGPPRPGGDLLEQRALFVAAHPTQDVGFVSQVERLALSPCFSGSKMVCETCHDPHRSLVEPAERALVRAACSQCHADSAGVSVTREGPPCSRGEPLRNGAQDCVDCHMRSTGVFDVADVRVHDHFIRRAPGAPSAPGRLRMLEAPDGDWKRFTWPAEPAPEHVDDLGLWMMAWYRGQQFERALAVLDRDVHPRVAALPSYHHVRGSLLERAGRRDEALLEYRRALELDADEYSSAVNLGLLLGQLGRAQEGLKVLGDLLRRHPRVEGALRNRAILHNQLGDYASMARDLEAAYAILPQAAVANSLAAYYRQAGDAERASDWAVQAALQDPVRYGSD